MLFRSKMELLNKNSKFTYQPSFDLPANLSIWTDRTESRNINIHQFYKKKNGITESTGKISVSKDLSQLWETTNELNKFKFKKKTSINPSMYKSQSRKVLGYQNCLSICKSETDLFNLNLTNGVDIQHKSIKIIKPISNFER